MFPVLQKHTREWLIQIVLPKYTNYQQGLSTFVSSQKEQNMVVKNLPKARVDFVLLMTARLIF